MAKKKKELDTETDKIIVESKTIEKKKTKKNNKKIKDENNLSETIEEKNEEVNIEKTKIEEKDIEKEKLLEKTKILELELEKTRQIQMLEKEIDNEFRNLDEFNEKNTFGRLLTYMLLATAFVSIVCLFIYTYINSTNDINQIFSIISMGILTVFTFFFIIQSLFMDNKKGRIISSISSILLIFYSIFTLGVNMGYLILPTQEYVPNFSGRTLTEVISWASSNKIELEQVYETSDTVEEYLIISQDVDKYTLVKNVEKITVVVSEGPNYDKELALQSFIGRNIDDFIKFMNDNFLTNVEIEFKYSDNDKDIILTQDKSGQIKRNDKVNITVSLGSEDSLQNVDMINLIDKDTFNATLFLKRNGIKYELKYDYSSKIKRGNVISQSISEGKNIDILNDKVELTISKGPEIKVINLDKMSVDEITKWVMDNNLRVEFNEDYDDEKSSGSVINVSFKEGDIIEQGETIKVTISKGQLKMESFKTAVEFRAWAEKYNINYKEEYQFNDSVASGNIIKMSHNEGQIIKKNDTVVVYISQGKSVTVPDFAGMSKSDIQSKCKSIGLSCTFKYGGYNDSVSKDKSIGQNKKSGSVVASGTSVQITLSEGKAPSYSVVIQSNWMSAGNPETTISTLKSKLSSACPGVTFKFVKKSVNTGVGLITQDSPTKGGQNTFVAGKTYTFYIGS